MKELFVNKASSRALRFDSSIGNITSHTDVKLQLHLLSVSNAPFPHLYARKILGYYNDSLFQQRKYQKPCKHVQSYSSRRLETNETPNFLTKHMQICIFLEEILESWRNSALDVGKLSLC